MPYVVTDTDRQILRSFVVFPFLTVRQVVRLHFRLGSATTASTRLRQLFLEGLLQRQSLPSMSQAGSVPWIYSLAPGGRRYLRQHGEDAGYHLYPSRLRRLTDYEDLRHDLGVTDVLIGGYVFAQHHPHIRLVRTLHDRTLRAMRQLPVVFDGWVAFQLSAREEQCLAIEYERTVKSASAFQRKIVALLELITPSETGKSPYEDVFGTRSVTIAYVTTVSGTYARIMKQRIEEVLQACHKEYEADVFRLLFVPLGAVDPGIFVQRVWYRPFTTQLVSLGET